MPRRGALIPVPNDTRRMTLLGALGALTGAATPYLASSLFDQAATGVQVAADIQRGINAVSNTYDTYRGPVKKLPYKATKKRTHTEMKKGKKPKAKAAMMYYPPALGFGSRRMNRFLYLNRNRRFRRPPRTRTRYRWRT